MNVLPGPLPYLIQKRCACAARGPRGTRPRPRSVVWGRYIMRISSSSSEGLLCSCRLGVWLGAGAVADGDAEMALVLVRARAAEEGLGDEGSAAADDGGAMGGGDEE